METTDPSPAGSAGEASEATAATDRAERSRIALAALGGGLALGLLGDLLLAEPLGLNLALWVGAAVLAVFGAARAAGIPLVGGGRWLLAAAVGCAAAVAWRDSPSLTVANALGAFVALGIATFCTREGRPTAAGVFDFLTALLVAGVQACFGGLFTAFEARLPRGPRGRWTRTSAAVLRGLAIALPIVLLFGSLFVAADAHFAALTADLFRVDPLTLVRHLFVALLIAWPVVGALRQTLLGERPIRSVGAAPTWLSLGIIELGIVLGSLDLLFAAFVAVQLPYLFGGAALVLASPTLTFSDYARRGFFELIAVGALALPLLLWADWSLRRERPQNTLVFRWLAGGLVGLLFVVLASALQRLLVYVGEFGLTELRLYPAAAMAWLALVFLWLILTVLRGRRDRFAVGALAAGFLILFALNVLNPDDLIARTNVARGQAGLKTDAAYLARLSADAVPTLVTALPTLPESERSVVEKRLREADLRSTDWRTWNVSRATARAALPAELRLD